MGVWVAGGWCVGALLTLFYRTKNLGVQPLFSKPAGDAHAGIRYAFIQGMAPQAKESVRMNPFSYLAGMVYHTGLLAAFGLLLGSLVGLRLSKVLGVMALAGALAGLALLGKRALKAHLRGLSCPDDFVSNLLATGFAALAGGVSFWPSLAPWWQGEAVLLLLYAPLGKIRHCLFFFPTRRHFGAFFGRRGVLPPAV